MIVRLTPNLRSVRPRVRSISRVRSSGEGCVKADRKARHPVCAPAATSSARPTFCMPPSVIGCSTSNRSVNRVLMDALAPGRSTMKCIVYNKPMSRANSARWQGREVVIVGAARTPIGRGHREKGWFRDIHPNELLGAAYRGVIDRVGIDAGLVEGVVAGCVSQVGEQSNNIARNAWLQAGLPATTPANTVDIQCGSAQQAVSFAAGLIAAGVHDVMIGAGVEHMGRVPMGSNVAEESLRVPFPKELMDRYELIPQ